MESNDGLRASLTRPAPVLAAHLTQATRVEVRLWLDTEGVPWADARYGGLRIYPRAYQRAIDVADGEYILRDSAGQFYTCRQQRFERTYRPVPRALYRVLNAKVIGHNLELVIQFAHTEEALEKSAPLVLTRDMRFGDDPIGTLAEQIAYMREDLDAGVPFGTSEIVRYASEIGSV